MRWALAGPAPAPLSGDREFPPPASASGFEPESPTAWHAVGILTARRPLLCVSFRHAAAPKALIASFVRSTHRPIRSLAQSPRIALQYGQRSGICVGGGGGAIANHGFLTGTGCSI